MRRRGHHVDKLPAGVLRVAGHKAQQVVPRDAVELGQQGGKAAPGPGVPAVGVDVLPQQRDVAVARLHQPAHLVKDRLPAAAALPPPHIGDNAVGAEVVAAVHHRDPCPVGAGAAHGAALGHGGLLLRRHKQPPPARQTLVQQLREAPDRRGAEGQIDIRVPPLQLLQPVGLGGHTAAHRHNQAGAARLEVLVLPHRGERPFFGVLADGAGVHHNQVGLVGPAAQLVSHRLRHAGEPLAVGLVLLAAKGQHIGARRRAGRRPVRRAARAHPFQSGGRLRLCPGRYPAGGLPRAGLPRRTGGGRLVVFLHRFAVLLRSAPGLAPVADSSYYYTIKTGKCQEPETVAGQPPAKKPPALRAGPPARGCRPERPRAGGRR